MSRPQLLSPRDFLLDPVEAFLNARRSEGWQALWLEAPSFGAQLREWRGACQMSMRAAGRLLGVSHTLVSTMESGRLLPRRNLVMLQAIAGAYRRDPREVLEAVGLRYLCPPERSDPLSSSERLALLFAHPDLSVTGELSVSALPAGLHDALLSWAMRIDANAREGGPELSVSWGAP